ncbi:STAS domain-containing protein [Pararhizobium antarcticum]|uniref:STAS domain-containing protein n=1 Tax=Pararhizobium antarcticum TaxID=1798805 RepID=UPI0008FFC52E|nr:STAS domain-containing protein [Pararhizobium antarcticum]
MQISADTAAPLKLTGALTIRTVAEVKERLSGLISNNGEVTLEIAETSQVDLSFVQLIEAARAYAESCRKTLLLKAPASGGLLDVLTRGGFNDEISSETAKFWLHRETV